MNIVDDVQAILSRPKEEWLRIKEDPTSVSHLLTTYAAILALVPAFAQFVSFGFIGLRVSQKGWITYGMGMALFRSILFYILTLVSVYVLGLVINFLAPNFSSTQDKLKAMKLAVFSMIPVWLGGVFYIVYPLRGLSIIAGLYGIYIFYLGITAPLLDTPREKVVPFLLVNAFVAVVLIVVVSNMLKLIFAAWTIYRSI